MLAFKNPDLIHTPSCRNVIRSNLQLGQFLLLWLTLTFAKTMTSNAKRFAVTGPRNVDSGGT